MTYRKEEKLFSCLFKIIAPFILLPLFTKAFKAMDKVIFEAMDKVYKKIRK
jgi:hypothetical protein